MKAWDEIATAALIGTERGAFAPPRLGGALGEALARVPGETAEARLLGCAAVLDGCGRAGFAAGEYRGELPQPAGEEAMAGCSTKAEQLLLKLLERAEEALGQWREELILEWLDLAGRAGKRLPPAALPALLEEGVTKVDWRERMQPLLGKRGGWLAGQNPDWAWALGAAEGETSAKDWEEGAPAERKAWLRRLRKKDPKQARERLEAVWKQEPAQTRAALLEQLGEGLSMEDEPFLEAALDDKSKEVRRVAVELLAGLPDSRFARRMIERAEPLIQFQKKLLGGVKMEVEPPPLETDAAWQRDGLVKEPSGAEAGARATMLTAIISAIPLDYWTKKSGAPPAELIKCAGKTDWAAALVNGWAEAARRQRDSKWCQALILNNNEKPGNYDGSPLWDALEDDIMEQTLGISVEQKKGKWDRFLVLGGALDATKRPLGPSLTRKALTLLQEALPTDPKRGMSYYDYYTAKHLMEIALRAAPELYPEAERMAREILEKKTEWRNTLEKFLALYEFRHAMHKELSQ